MFSWLCPTMWTKTPYDNRPHRYIQILNLSELIDVGENPSDSDESDWMLKPNNGVSKRRRSSDSGSEQIKRYGTRVPSQSNQTQTADFLQNSQHEKQSHESIHSDDFYPMEDTDISGDSEYESFDETEEKLAEEDEISDRLARRIEMM